MTAHSYRDTLKHRGLQPFLWPQFLGAFNDNLFKIVVSMLAVSMAASIYVLSVVPEFLVRFCLWLIGKEGLLLVNGPNRMLGYLGEPERTAEVLCDGWYATGDIACIDEAGFIRITDRLSRFSKIAGEMVPHMKIEEQIQSRLDAKYTCSVTAVRDDARGERLVAFYTDPVLQASDLWERLCRTELPRLWLPKREDLRFLEAIPSLGTGKVDLRAVRQLAATAAEVGA